jgi:ABC-type glycerol-3-phosphate transport system substrate-binding protein
MQRIGRRGLGQFAAAGAILAATARPARAARSLRYWSFLEPGGADPRAAAQTTTIERFTAANPDIAVTVEVVHWSKVVPLLITAAGAGQAPDVALIHSSRIPMAVESGAIVPLDRFIATLPAADRDDFLVPLDQQGYHGKLYSLPWEHRVESTLMYRADLLAAAGIDAPPATWDALADAARKLSQPPVWGFVWALSRKDAAAMIKVLQTVYWSGGGDFYHPDGSAAVNSPIGLRIAETLSRLVSPLRVMPRDIIGVEEGRGMMKAGATAMLVDGSQVFGSIRSGKVVGDSLRTAPLPGFDAGKPPPAIVSGQTLAISKDAKDPEAAWRFIDWMTQPESQLTNAMVGSLLPVRLSTFSAPWFATPPARELLTWRDTIRRDSRPFIETELSDFMDDCLGLAYEQLLTGRATPKQALDRAASRFDERWQATR